MTAEVSAQAISGRVTDSTTGMPIARVRVTVSNPAMTVPGISDDRGVFQINLPRAGTYAVQLRQIGYVPKTITVTVRLDQRHDSSYVLAPLVTALDTVFSRASDAGLFRVTPGREWFRQHFARGIGQFVSGLEIQRSGMSVLEYLGTIPGLKHVTFVPTPSESSLHVSSPPTIPGRTGFLLSSQGPQCLYGRIDRWSIAGLLDQVKSMFVDDVIQAEDIMGVEVYLPGEIPSEWRFEGIQRIVMRVHHGLAYLIGDTGTPRVPRFEIDLTRGRDVKQLRITQAKRPLEAAPPPQDSLKLYDLVSVPPPQCAFVQIWTRIAW